MVSLRKFFFYLFILIYVACCPILILYALGYIYNPRAGQGVVKSGLIYLSTTPTGATVYLGNRKYRNRTPSVIQDLIPDDYSVRVVKKKHRVWTKTVPVEAGKATVLERIILLPDQLKLEQLIPNESFKTMIPIPQTHYLILTKGEKASDVYIYDYKSDDLKPIFPIPTDLTDERYLGFYLSEKSQAFILRQAGSDGERYLWVSPERKEIRTKDITVLFPAKPDSIEWDSDQRNYIFSFRDGLIDMLNVVTKMSHNQFLSGVRGFGLDENYVYSLSLDFTLEKIDYEGKKEKLLFDNQFLGEKLFGNHVYQIKKFPGGIMIFLSDEGRLVINRFPYQFVEKGVLGAQFDEKQKRLLLWTEQSIGIVDFAKPKLGQEFSNATAKLTWIYKQGERIDQAFWAYEGSHVIFKDRDLLFLLEIETYGKPHLTELFQVKNKTAIDYVESSGYVYYLDTDGRLMRFELVPRREILDLPFPERKEEQKKTEIATL